MFGVEIRDVGDKVITFIESLASELSLCVNAREICGCFVACDDGISRHGRSTVCLDAETNGVLDILADSHEAPGVASVPFIPRGIVGCPRCVHGL